jgi:hypothetical protein
MGRRLLEYQPVVLEANEEAIAARHLRAFLMAALVALN